MLNIVTLKQLFAILLLQVHAFNLAGYSLVFEYFMARTDQKIEHRLDRHQYDESDLIELKAPLPIPYLSDWTDYERADGQIIIGGIHYQYVMRKVQRDSIFVLCLPNLEKSELALQRVRYGNKANDLPANREDAPLVKKIIQSSPYRQQESPEISIAPPECTIQARFQPFDSDLLARVGESIFQPPDYLG